jgi:hypothetical protein
MRFKTGRRYPAKSDIRTLKLEKYIQNTHSFPNTMDYSSGISRWPMYGNARHGTCVPAACAHLWQVWLQTQHNKSGIMRNQKILNFYQRACGKGDTGCYTEDVLNFWRNKGFGRQRKISGYASVAFDHQSITQAIWQCGGVLHGFVAPESVFTSLVNVPPDGLWDVGVSESGTIYGHEVLLMGYSSDQYSVVSWGQRNLMSRAFFEKYTDEAHVALSSVWQQPSEFNIKQFLVDVEEVTKN